MYLSVGYLLVSWWPHLNMPFHLPLEISGVVLALCVLSLMVERAGRETEPAAPTV